MDALYASSASPLNRFRSEADLVRLDMLSITARVLNIWGLSQAVLRQLARQAAERALTADELEMVRVLIFNNAVTAISKISDGYVARMHEIVGTMNVGMFFGLRMNIQDFALDLSLRQMHHGVHRAD